MIDYLLLGQRVQKRRKELRKTQENLAEAISVTVGYISQIERGITKVNLETLSEIAAVLNCDITDFLSDTSRSAPEYLASEFASVFVNLTPSNRKAVLQLARTLLETQ